MDDGGMNLQSFSDKLRISSKTDAKTTEVELFWLESSVSPFQVLLQAHLGH